MQRLHRTLLVCLVCAALSVAFLGGTLLGARASVRTGAETVTLVVSNLELERRFFIDVLGFEPVAELSLAGRSLESLLGFAPATLQGNTLRVGQERISLVRIGPRRGRSMPQDSRSQDSWFQHLALVVPDMDRTYARLKAHQVAAISRGGPQTIPASNPAAGGIRAFYFRDPEGHPLELIWFPKGKGDPRWQQTRDVPVLGIDHTAIAVRDNERSESFYREVAGLSVKGRSYNVGAEQEALSAVPGARVHITGLRGAMGIGVEFLRYEAPTDGRALAPDSTPCDLWSTETTIHVAQLDIAMAAARRHGARLDSKGPVLLDGARVIRLRDPDGHALRLVEP